MFEIRNLKSHVVTEAVKQKQTHFCSGSFMSVDLCRFEFDIMLSDSVIWHLPSAFTNELGFCRSTHILLNLNQYSCLHRLRFTDDENTLRVS